jgi:hypothetical protein
MAAELVSTSTAKGRKRCETRLLKARADHAAGMPVAVERQSVAVLLDWLENSARPSVRPATYRSYEQTIRNHLIPELGRHPLRKLEPQHVRSVLNRKLTSGWVVGAFSRVPSLRSSSSVESGAELESHRA